MLQVVIKSLLAPQLYLIHQTENSSGRNYIPNTAESFGDGVMKWIKIGWSLSWWTSPVLLTFLYRRGAFTGEGLPVLTTYIASIGAVYVLAIIVRAFGRLLNQDYTTFLRVLIEAQRTTHPDAKKRLSQYDFEFSAWPVDFEHFRSGSNRVNISSPRRYSLLERVNGLPCQILAYIAVHTFGRRMLYPGTTSLIHALIKPMLIQGRAKLVEENNGLRAKLRTSDGNDIDTMFVDRRGSASSNNGNKLVICSEGNSAFYEVGCMCTPLDSGYSVLGWNHPGFAGSTGVPFPNQEQNAIDAVVQYAIQRLNFTPDSIVLFAWSIGGYAASWAAMSYPDIGHVVLDATFDDILPLAVVKLPNSWRNIVEVAVRQYLNLNNAELLEKYPGPLLLIRRSNDEMITTVDQSVISSNRGNNLIVKLLRCRYPHVIDESTIPYLREWLSVDHSGQVAVWTKYGVDSDDCINLIQSKPEWKSGSYPSSLGEGLSHENKIALALFLVNKYMEEYDATHCTPLPQIYFHQPWTEAKL